MNNFMSVTETLRNTNIDMLCTYIGGFQLSTVEVGDEEVGNDDFQ